MLQVSGRPAIGFRANGFLTLVMRSHGKPLFMERYGEGFDPNIGSGDIEIWIPVEKDKIKVQYNVQYLVDLWPKKKKGIAKPHIHKSIL